LLILGIAITPTRSAEAIAELFEPRRHARLHRRIDHDRDQNFIIIGPPNL